MHSYAYNATRNRLYFCMPIWLSLLSINLSCLNRNSLLQVAYIFELPRTVFTVAVVIGTIKFMPFTYRQNI